MLDMLLQTFCSPFIYLLSNDIGPIIFCHSCLEWMHSRIVFSSQHNSVTVLYSGKLLQRFQFWLTSEKHSSTYSSYFYLGAGSVI